MKWLDLVFLSGSVYGVARIITKSKLFGSIRNMCLGVPFLGDLILCIVCTSVWVGFLVMALLPYCTLVSFRVSISSPVDALLLTGWITSTTWAIGRGLGDAD